MDELEIFRAAYRGDFEPLIEFLRADTQVQPRHRELLIKILEGKLIKPPNRPPQTKVYKRKLAIGSRAAALENEGWKQTAILKQVEEEFDCGETLVKQALKLHRKLKKQEESFYITLDGHRLYCGPMNEDLEEWYRDVGLKYWSKPRIFKWLGPGDPPPIHPLGCRPYIEWTEPDELPPLRRRRYIGGKWVDVDPDEPPVA